MTTCVTGRRRQEEERVVSHAETGRANRGSSRFLTKDASNRNPQISMPHSPVLALTHSRNDRGSMANLVLRESETVWSVRFVEPWMKLTIRSGERLRKRKKDCISWCWNPGRHKADALLRRSVSRLFLLPRPEGRSVPSSSTLYPRQDQFFFSATRTSQPCRGAVSPAILG